MKTNQLIVLIFLGIIFLFQLFLFNEMVIVKTKINKFKMGLTDEIEDVEVQVSSNISSIDKLKHDICEVIEEFDEVVYKDKGFKLGITPKTRCKIEP